MKPTITLKPFHLRGGEQIGIYFKNNSALNILVRSKAGSTWSQTGKCWYVPLTRNAFDRLKTALQEHASIETTELKKYLEEKKKRRPVAKELMASSVAIQKTSLKVIPLFHLSTGMYCPR